MKQIKKMTSFSKARRKIVSFVKQNDMYHKDKQNL